MNPRIYVLKFYLSLIHTLCKGLKTHHTLQNSIIQSIGEKHPQDEE